jgi:hypothetical protein
MMKPLLVPPTHILFVAFFALITKNLGFYRGPTMVVPFGVAKLFGQG